MRKDDQGPGAGRCTWLGRGISHDVGAHSLVAASGVLFGCSLVLTRVTLDTGAPEVILATRFSIASLLLTAVLIVRGRPIFPVRGEWTRIVILAIVGYGLEALMFFHATLHGTVAALSVLFYTYPTLAAFGVAVLHRRPLTRTGVFALISSTVGAAIVLLVGRDFRLDAFGALFALLAAIAYATYLIGADIWIKRTSPMTAAAWLTGISAVALLVFGVATDRGGLPASGHGWGLVSLAGLLSALAFVCLLTGLPRIGAARAGILSTGELLAVVILGHVLLDEGVTLGTLLGGACIVVAIVLAARDRPR